MTTNKPNVQRYDNMGCPEQICRVDTMHKSDDGDYVLYAGNLTTRIGRSGLSRSAPNSDGVYSRPTTLAPGMSAIGLGRR